MSFGLEIVGNLCKIYKKNWHQVLKKNKKYVLISLDAKLFPLILYSDKSTMFSSGNQRMHPIVIAPAGVPRSIWKQSSCRYILGFVSENASFDEALESLGYLLM
jgi:hypothetical protein